MRVFVALLVALLAFAPAQAETRWSLVRSYPHDDKAFTQGLIWLDGALYESTGQYGASNLREVRLEDGAVQRSVPLSPRYFGEGLTHWGDALISITWRNGIGFRWDRATFREVATFRYAGEGWGLANDGTRLILSDGSAELRFLDPVTLEELAGQPDDLPDLVRAVLALVARGADGGGVGLELNQGDAVGGAHFSMMNTSELVEPSRRLPVARLPSSICLSTASSWSRSSMMG